VAEDLDGNGAPDDLLDVGADEGDLGHEPERAARPVRVLVAAELGEVPPRGHPEARGEQLHEQPHGRGPEEEPEQGAAGRGAGLEVALDVPGVHEGDAHQIPGAREEPELAPGEGRRAAPRGVEEALLVGVARDGDDDLLGRLERALLEALVVAGDGGDGRRGTEEGATLGAGGGGRALGGLSVGGHRVGVRRRRG